MDGAGNTLLQQGQAEIARQLNQLSERVGSFSAQLADRVTHRELMQEFGGFRKEFSGKLDHMEVKFDQAAEKVDTSLEKAIERIQDKLATTAVKAVGEAMEAREKTDAKAQAAITAREADIDRRIRRSERNGVVGGGIGVIGLLVAVAQNMGWLG